MSFTEIDCRIAIALAAAKFFAQSSAHWLVQVAIGS